ncbi:MAG TPA: folylpolyglutamate synthase/dihydrofolate synthase family protein [Methanomassiliicoccales archaeon]|nr:folylpolyglutamate synthase/dihydrofolate synthase family protein [Methanomassiliicoccales archaeon]
MDREEAVDWLYGLELMGIKLGLRNIKELLHRMGDPQVQFKCVHVAGTNGKGSVSAMIESVFRAEGYRTGLYTSPHLVSFNERIQVDGADIPDRDLARLAEEVRGHAEDMALVSKEGHVTFFEASTAIAFAYFAEKGVDFAAVEVGMGGRLDATNVVSPESTVITRISLEHTTYLGTTVREIASEKAGIIKPGVPVITAEHGMEAFKVIEARASEVRSALELVGRDIRLKLLDETLDRTRVEIEGLGEVDLPLLGSYQGENASLAFGASIAARERGMQLSDDAIVRGLERVRWPGRLDLVARRPYVVFDVSHTPDGARVVAQDIAKLFGRKVMLVLGVLNDKDLEGIAKEFGLIAKSAVAVSPWTPRAYPSGVVAEALRRHMPLVTEGPSVAAGVRDTLFAANEDDVVLVTGSLYTVGEAMAWWRALEAR